MPLCIIHTGCRNGTRSSITSYASDADIFEKNTVVRIISSYLRADVGAWVQV